MITTARLAQLLVWPCFMLAVFVLPHNVHAAGTPSGTDITNIATIDYTVDSISYPTITSSVSFKVANKIDLSVTSSDATSVKVAPNAQDRVLSFLVTNNGNTVQDYSLRAVSDSDTGTRSLYNVDDTFDAANVQIFVDANGNGEYDVSTDTAIYIDELAPDASAIVFIVADMPDTIVEGNGALYDLVAQTAQGGTAGSQGADTTSDQSGETDDPSTVQIVFADAAGTNDNVHDGRHSDDGIYAATIAVTILKSRAIVDPWGGSQAFSGAVITYSLEVTVTGTETVKDVVITDSIPENTTYIAGTLTLDGTLLTDVLDADKGDVSQTTPDTVTVNMGDMNAGSGRKTISFKVMIND